MDPGNAMNARTAARVLVDFSRQQPKRLLVVSDLEARVRVARCLLEFHFLPEFIEETSQLSFDCVDCPLPIDHTIHFLRIDRQAVITGAKVATVKLVVGGGHPTR